MIYKLVTRVIQYFCFPERPMKGAGFLIVGGGVPGGGGGGAPHLTVFCNPPPPHQNQFPPMGCPPFKNEALPSEKQLPPPPSIET